MREHGSELAQIDRPAAGRARYARPRLLAGTTVGFAVIATAIVLFLSAASTPAAFAVSGNSDGTVSVMLRRFAGIKGANERLQALGIRAKFVQVAAGCRAAVPPAALAQIKTPDQVLSHAGRQTRIDPREIPPGRMVMIMSWIKARQRALPQVGRRGEGSPDCIAGPAPQALRFAWAVAHGCHIGEVKARRRGHRASTGRCLDVTRKPGGQVTIDMGRGRKGAPTGNSGHGGAHRQQRRTHGNSGPFTGNSGPPAGNSGGPVTAVPRPKQIRMAPGCPKPTWFPKRPGTGTAARPVTAGTPGRPATAGTPATAATAATAARRHHHRRPYHQVALDLALGL